MRNSWANREPTLYGRFDLMLQPDGHSKLLEYNADTPTCILESGVVQQQWLVEHGAALCASMLQPAGGGGPPRVSQFNHIHAAMVASWARMGITSDVMHFGCVKHHHEDLRVVEYLRVSGAGGAAHSPTCTG